MYLETITPTPNSFHGTTQTIYSSPPRILLYSHDTFGLGNIRRTLLLSQELTERYPDASIQIMDCFW